MRRWFLLGFIAYLLVLFKLLFLKIKFAYSDIAITTNENVAFSVLLAHSNFIPFYRIYYYLSGQEPYQVGALNLVGNIVLFVPMGFFLPYFFAALRKTGWLLVVAASLSLFIEVMQLLTTTGEFDIDDVLLNTTGSLLGYFLFCKIKNLARQ